MATRSDETIVRNTSGHNGKFFSFLGEHGATLDDGDDVAIPGNLLDRWTHDSINRAAFQYALNHGLITIIKTPDVFAYDSTDQQVYRLGFDNGDPVAIDPDYGSYAGGPPDPGNP